MQPNPPPPTRPFPPLRSHFGLLLAFGALVLIVAAGVGGYLLGASQVGHATLEVQVMNTMGSNTTAQVTVNGALAGTLSIGADQTGAINVPVAYATANGASFQIQAISSTGPHASTTVYVNAPNTFVVSLQLG